MTTGALVLRAGVQRLTAAGIEGAARDARLLLAHAWGVPMGRLTLVLPEALPEGVEAAFDGLIARRAAREPLSHLTGLRAFYGRAFKVTSAVLDPRPDTETLIDVALSAPFTRLLDLGTGSGCIAITLLAERPEAQGEAFDLSSEALAVAQENAQTLGVAERLALKQSNWLAEAQGQYDLIVSNPPYIAEDEMAGLEPEVRLHEPWMALTDGADGLLAYRAICEEARAFLAPQGRLIFEFGPTQAQAITQIAQSLGWQRLELRQDWDGRDRVLVFGFPAS